MVMTESRRSRAAARVRTGPGPATPAVNRVLRRNLKDSRGCPTEISRLCPRAKRTESESQSVAQAPGAAAGPGPGVSLQVSRALRLALAGRRRCHLQPRPAPRAGVSAESETVTLARHWLDGCAGQPDSKANPECQPKRKVKWSDLLSALDCLYRGCAES